jgi:predicted peroxiredoxin
MVTILYFGTHGYEDPTKATIPFFLATGALEAGYQTHIALGGEAPLVMKDATAEQIQGVGIPPLKELIKKLVESKVPMYV